MHTERSRFTMKVPQQRRRRHAGAPEVPAREIKGNGAHVPFGVVAHRGIKRHQVVYERRQAGRVARFELMFELPFGDVFQDVTRGHKRRLIVIQRVDGILQCFRRRPFRKQVIKRG